MTPALVSSVASTSSAATTHTITAPSAAVPNNWMFLQLEIDSADKLTIPDGWDLIAVKNNTASQGFVFSRVFQPGDFTWSFITSVSTDVSWTISAWSGLDNFRPVSDTQYIYSATTSVVMPSAESPKATTLVLDVIGWKGAGTSVTVATGYTAIATQTGATNGVGSYQAYQLFDRQTVSAATYTLQATPTDAHGFRLVLLSSDSTVDGKYDGSTTLEEIINDIKMSLAGWVTMDDQVTYLSSAISTVTATSVSVNDGTRCSAGVIEIGDELMYMLSRSSNTLTIAPWGRGFGNTDPNIWPTNTQVTSNPKFPRARVKDVVNDVIRSVYAYVFDVGQFEFTYVAARQSYDLPGDVDKILSVTWDTPGPTLIQQPVRKWRQDNHMTGIKLEILQPVWPGRTVRILYSKRPGTFTDTKQTLRIIGLPEEVRELLVLGACARLLGYNESPRLNTNSVDAQMRNIAVPAGSHTSASRYFWQLYERRRDEERDQLLRRYPPIINYTR